MSAGPREGASPPHWMLWLWPLLDRLLARLLRIKPLDETDSIMGTSIHHYRGQLRVLRDGTIIRSGAMICEIHILNGRLARLALESPQGEITPWELAAWGARDLTILAGMMKQASEVEALSGTTLLDSVVKRQGFAVMDMPSKLLREVVGFYLRGLMQAYHSRGARRTERKARSLVPKEIWMSRKELLARYGSGSP
ncbi:MAG: putative rane protein [Dehalococcoidia bacterium]|nr:putative rane protein [Dehalococcoidia bacterium]